MSSLYLNASEQQLLSALTKMKVRYVVVGGHAVQFHGHVRPAKDLDICVEPTIDNARLVGSALSSLNPPVRLSSDEVDRLSRPKLQMRVNGIYHLEILTTILGVDTSAAINNALDVVDGAINTKVLSFSDLIKSKRALGRPNDLEDVAALSKITSVG